MKSVRMIVKGKVQGVFYRASAKNMANKLKITGRVKNLPDKTVEIIATASEDNLKLFIDWCRQGPPGAIVQEVVVKYISTEEYNDFRIIK